MDNNERQALLNQLYSAEVRIEALTMILIEELGMTREKIQKAVDLVVKYSIIGDEEKLDGDTIYQRRATAYHQEPKEGATNKTKTRSSKSS
jgi:hypothetical protein